MLPLYSIVSSERAPFHDRWLPPGGALYFGRFCQIFPLAALSDIPLSFCSAVGSHFRRKFHFRGSASSKINRTDRTNLRRNLARMWVFLHVFGAFPSKRRREVVCSRARSAPAKDRRKCVVSEAMQKVRTSLFSVLKMKIKIVGTADCFSVFHRMIVFVKNVAVPRQNFAVPKKKCKIFQKFIMRTIGFLHPKKVAVPFLSCLRPI